MKALPIDKEFTTQYVQDLQTFFGLLRTKVHSVRFSHQSAYTAISEICGKLDTIVRTSKKSKKPMSQTISLSPNLLLEIDDHQLKRQIGKRLLLSLGGWIEIKEGILIRQSFCIAVLCQVDSNMLQDEADRHRCYPLTSGTHVLRKFHFDLDRSLSDEQMWPRSHLQYGGKFSPEIFAVDEGLQYHLFAPLDHPRFPAMPYSLILCIDLAFRTFLTSGTKLTKERYWTDKIRESESRWIKPFLEQTLEFLNSSQRNETLWDFFSSKNEG
ncbi:hypothetical protein [Halioxenophilus aromaticivorans]|uniref:hypothetical protein n=1 Tax=Halioxenophilus aromaticivorans TaxID=1306992 RepID=UPI0031E59986